MQIKILECVHLFQLDYVQVLIYENNFFTLTQLTFVKLMLRYQMEKRLTAVIARQAAVSQDVTLFYTPWHSDGIKIN